jgi:hypothetical protein
MEAVITLDKEPDENHASVPWPAEIAGVAAKLAEAREQLSASIGNARLESYSKFCELSTEMVGLNKELEKLSAEYEKAKWKLKLSACVLLAAVVLGGYLGFRYGYVEFYRDVKDTVTRKLEGEIRKGVISEERFFYDDLVAGNALDAAGQYAHATERLMGCFKEGHYHDGAVLLPLLDAIYKSNDWENAQTVLDVLKKEEPPLGGARDHTILAYLGAIEVRCRTAPGHYTESATVAWAFVQPKRRAICAADASG